MNEKILDLVTAELSDMLVGRWFGAIFSLSRYDLAIDFRIESGLFLFVSVEPGNPRVYLIRRRMKDLAKASQNLSPFLLVLRKALSGAEVVSVNKLEKERVLMIQFASLAETGSMIKSFLAVQITGRSANVFLLDGEKRVVDSFRRSEMLGQRISEVYSVPPRPEQRIAAAADDQVPEFSGSISAFLDLEQIEKESARRFESRASAERNKLKQEITKRRRLLKKLKSDLEEHGDAENWKQMGDLLLANVANAKREGDKIIVTDFYDPNLRQIEIQAEPNESITEVAEKFFKRYTKARNAASEIANRIEKTDTELVDLEDRSQKLEEAVKQCDESYFEIDEASTPLSKRKKKADGGFNGARTFISSDGLEILVGKKAVDNDYLSFRIAKSLDFWFHAADYPGSHVVVRNPRRKELPQKTLVESAQLAAFYSSGRSQVKAAVNYTQKKFVNKSKGAPAGQVKLSQFKTILVEPRVPETVTKKE